MLLIFLIFLFPLLNFIIHLSIGKKLPFANYIAVGNIAAACICSILLFNEIWASDKVIAGSWEWLSFTQPYLQGKQSLFSIDIYIDKLSALMLLLVTGVALLVHIFSIEYMRNEPYLHRYWGYLGLFCAAMLGILVSGNLLIMFICWELVGASSYLLIGFWFTKEAPAKASEKAFLVNRIGDIGFLAGILILYSTFGTLNLHELNDIFSTAVHNSGDVWQFTLQNNFQVSTFQIQLTLIGLLLFCGCIAKSAQFPLQVWLPDAMEGPTPISALIHAATMVAAGVYLTAKIYALFTLDALTVIAIIGAITAFIAAVSAISQTDIKKVLAYSTISQLGYMVMAIGVHGYGFSLFHLLTHAFFKCGLFLIAAIIIHEMQHQIDALAAKHPSLANISAQDMRYMGGMRKYMPKTFYAYMICMLALAGVPLFSGFLSKEGILIQTLQWAGAQQEMGNWACIVPILGFMTAAITAFYMTRHAILIFGGRNRLLQHRNINLLGLKYYLLGHVRKRNQAPSVNTFIESLHFHEAKAIMLLPVCVLAILSLFIWFSFSPIEAKNSWLLLNILPPKNIFIPTETHGHISHIWVSIISIALVSIGSLIAFSLWNKDLKYLTSRFPFQINFSSLYDKILVQPLFQLSKNLAIFDKKIIDGLVNLVAYLIINPHRGSTSISLLAAKFDYHIIDGIVNTIGKGTKKVGSTAQNIQTGSLQKYILFALIALLLLGGSAWFMLKGKPFTPKNTNTSLVESHYYSVWKALCTKDKMLADFAETGYFSPVLFNESELIATDSLEFARINTALGDSFAFAKSDFAFFESQFKAHPDSFLIVKDSFPKNKISTFSSLASSLGDSSSNQQGVWELFHEAKGSELRYYQISLPIFSQNLQQCLLSVKMQCGSNCAEGHKVLLRKVDGDWKVVKVFQKWGS